MKFNLTIDTSNSAFDPEPGVEVARILSKITRDVSDGLGESGRILDGNGNHVGDWTYENQMQ